MSFGLKHNVGRRLGFGCLLLVLFGAASCKKKVQPAPALASADADSISRLSNTINATPQEQKIAGGENVSVDGGGESYAHVTYNSNVKMIDDTDVSSSLEGITSDGHEWLFENAPASIRALKAGDMFMVKNEFAVKVVGAVTQDDQTLVVTDEALLHDLVQSGDMKLDAPVRFHGPKNAVSSAPPSLSLLDRLVPPVYAAQAGPQGGLEGPNSDAARAAGTKQAAKDAVKSVKKALTSGWTVVKWDVTPSDGQADFDLVMVKNLDGLVARIAMKGWIGNFDVATNMQFNSSIPQKLYQGITKSQGSIQFDWEIGRSEVGASTTEDRVKLPAALSVPLAPLLGGMPLTLDISAALQIHPVLTGNNQYSRGGFSLSWGGNGGFQTNSGGTVADGSTISSTFQLTADQSISAIAPNAMVISYCAPRIELRLDVLGKYASKVAKELSSFAKNIDSITSKLESLLPQSAKDIVANSWMSKMTASNVLASNADVYIQFITTEGSTHAGNVTSVPCSKQEIKFDVDAGTAAQFFGLTSGMKTSTNLYTKSYAHWAPDTAFCKGV
jgi:hypothetical protein